MILACTGEIIFQSRQVFEKSVPSPRNRKHDKNKNVTACIAPLTAGDQARRARLSKMRKLAAGSGATLVL